jgi:FkbM family methyltransferase
MNFVVSLFPGEIANLAFTARGFDKLGQGLNVDRIYLILLTHRQDSENSEGLVAILRERIVPLFGARLSRRVEIIRYDDLFPGTKGYSTSATAKAVSLLAFIANHFRNGDFAVLEPGEVIITAPGARHRDNVREPLANCCTKRLASSPVWRMEQACRLLGIPSSTASPGHGKRSETRLFRKSVLSQLNTNVDGGLCSIAPKLVSGELACDLSDLHDMWLRYRSPAFDRDRGACNGAQSDQVHLEIIPSDDSVASDPPLALDVALKSVVEEVAALVAALETFDPDLAARAIRLLVEECAGKVRFIQVGANDGTFLDPVAPFITSTWRGVVIEPIPEYFTLLKRRYANLPKVEAVEGAIGRERGARTMYVVDRSGTDDPDGETSPEWLKGLASFSAEHLLRHGVVQQRIREVSVPVFRGSDIVRDLMPGTVDLIVVDVEGAEREVLESFDLPEIRPSCIIFECEHLSEEDERELRSLFERSGYSLCWSRPDAVAFLTSAMAFRETFLISPAKAPRPIRRPPSHESRASGC